MKKLLFAAKFALCTLTIFAQSVPEKALAFGYNTRPAVLCPLAYGRFLVAGRGEVMPGELYTDTVFAVVFDAIGQIDLRLRLPVPSSERHTVNDAVPTPDGGFLISVSLALCDVANVGDLLLCYDVAGTLRWSKESNWNGPDLVPDNLDLGPDGEPLGIVGNTLIAYDYLNGNVLWQTTLYGQGPIDVDFFPGSLDFAAIGYDKLKIWRQFDLHTYYLDYSENVPNGNWATKVDARADGVYTSLAPSGEFVRYEESGYEVLTTLDNTDWVPVNDGFWFLNSTGDAVSLIKAGLNGQILDTLTIAEDPWRQGHLVSIQNNVVALAGVAGSGGADNANGFMEYRAEHLWFTTRHLALPNTPPVLHDAALTAVEQLTPVQVESGVQAIPPYAAVYSLSSATFRVHVTNTGLAKLDEVDVMILFGWNGLDGICFGKPAVRRHYANLTLPPGASVWLDFGLVEAAGQLVLPTQFCFWTAAPNEQPDADHSDDTFCHTVSVAAGEITPAASPRLWPNPATVGFWVAGLAPGTDALAYQLMDASGRIVATGQIAPTETHVQVPTTGLPPGLYFFQAGNWRGKVVVER